MSDQDKSKQQLLAENEELRRRVAELEANAGNGNGPWGLDNAQWHSLVANTPVFILILDQNGCIRFANHTDSGAPPDQIIGKNLCDFCRPEDRENIRGSLQQMFQTGEPVLREGPGIRLDAQEHWYASHLGPIFADGKVVAISLISFNITDRKRAEEALREREAQLFEAQEVASLGSHVVDLATGCITTSTVIDRIFGIPIDFERTLDKWEDLVHPDDRQEMLDYFKEVVGEKKLFDREYRIVRYGDKQVRWVHGLGRLQFNDDGQPISILVTVQDITERKRAEEALRESEERFRQAMEATSDGLWDWNVKSGNVYYSPAYSRMLGYEAAEFANRTESWTDLLHPDDRAEAIRVNHDCIENRLPDFEVEFRMQAKSGEWKTILGRGKAVCRDADGRAIRMIGTHVDITERKRAEEALKKAHDELERRVEERTAALTKANEQLKREVEERLLAEKALRQSERRFRNYFEQGLIGMTVTSVDKRWLEVNDRLCEILGYSQEELRQKTWPELTHPDDLEHNFLLFNRLLVGEIESFTFTKRFLKKDGGIVHATLHTRAFCSEDGTIDHIIVLVEDITERKQAEEALRTSEEKYRGVAEACPDAIVMSDLKGRVVFASRQTWRLLGLADADELVGRNVLDYVIESDRKRLAENMVNVVEVGVRRSTEYTALRKDGTTVPTEASSVVIRDAAGQPKAVMAVIRDITQRRQAEEALRASTERYELAVRGAGVGIWDWDIRTGKVYYSSRWKTLFGYDENDIGDGAEDWATLLHPAEREWILKFQEDFLAGTSPTTTVEYRLRHKDGSYRWIVAHGLALRDEQGRACRFVGSHGDITDRKRAEEATRQLLRTVDEERGRLQAIIDSLPVGLWIADATGKMILINDMARTIWGGTAPYAENTQDYGVYKAWWADTGNLIVVEDMPMVRSLRGETCKEKAIDFERFDGTIGTQLVSSTPIKTADGSIIGSVAIVQDITERKRAEEAVRQSHDELRAIYESLGDGLLVADRETLRLVRANAAIRSMLGYSKEELLSMSIADLHPKEALSDIVEQLQTDIVGHLPGKSNVPMLRKDGSIFYADITGDTFTYQGRSSSLGVFRDVTERRQAQEALERERQSLWRMLQASDHERQIISYDIHDGLAQYLAAAGMQFQVFDAIRESNPAEAKKAYDAATQLVSQSHSESRRLINAVRPPVIDENGVEMAISHLVHEQRRHGGPTIKFDSDVQFKRLPSILENAIYRIAQEALTNACKHSRAKRAAVTLVQEGQDVRLKVRDWGIGFDPESVEKGHFGLEGIRQRARLLGGRLTIESTPGSGTLIQVVVPIVEKQSEE